MNPLSLSMPFAKQKIETHLYPVIHIDDNEDSRVVIVIGDDIHEEPRFQVLEAAIVRETPWPDDSGRTWLRPITRACIELCAEGYIVAGVERGKSGGLPPHLRAQLGEEAWKAAGDEDPDAEWAPKVGDLLRIQCIDMDAAPTMPQMVAEIAKAFRSEGDRANARAWRERIEAKLDAILANVAELP